MWSLASWEMANSQLLTTVVGLQLTVTVDWALNLKESASWVAERFATNLWRMGQIHIKYNSSDVSKAPHLKEEISMKCSFYRKEMDNMAWQNILAIFSSICWVSFIPYLCGLKDSWQCCNHYVTKYLKEAREERIQICVRLELQCNVFGKPGGSQEAEREFGLELKLVCHL